MVDSGRNNKPMAGSLPKAKKLAAAALTLMPTHSEHAERPNIERTLGLFLNPRYGEELNDGINCTENQVVSGIDGC